MTTKDSRYLCDNKKLVTMATSIVHSFVRVE